MSTFDVVKLMELKDRTAAMIAEYQIAKKKLQGMVLVGGYVVRCDGIVLTFDVDSDGYVTNHRPCPPHRAHSFSLAQAQALACEFRNGNGVPAEAVHVVQAVDAALDAERATLDFLYTIKVEPDTDALCQLPSTLPQVDVMMMC